MLRMLVASLLVVVLVACEEQPEDTVLVGDQRFLVEDMTRAVEGVCEAQNQVEAGEVEAARDTFFDTAHDALHVLADGISTLDRQLAARLLVAKNAVEAGFESGDMDDHLADLETHLRRALQRIDINAPACE